MIPEERTVLERARVARLATATEDGTPHVVPICYAILEPAHSNRDDDSGLRIVSAIDEKPKSSRTLQRVRDVQANPRVALLVDQYREDWSRLAWVQVRGRARVVSSDPDGDADASTSVSTSDHDDGVAALESKYEQYGDHDLHDRPILEIRVDRVLSWGALEAYS
ncbi:TIGR03668 family PPOX class F420-dependent oxidoreductase [Natronorubrum sp. FCH18a]|uniref:TIGR03668 family PPOX class F420-dependent oxidoreductase n=1 Tax=Natronorubrum sp. FCH18a TaxID=3447018 RepID=UPI003F5113E8